MNERVAVLKSVHQAVPLAFVQEAVGSIFSQTYPLVDLWLACDGPLSAEVDWLLARLPADHCTAIRLGRNLGLPSALNRLLDEVIQAGRYDFVARMDADDVSEKERIEKQVEFLRARREVGIVGTWCTEIDANGRELLVKRLPIQHDDMLSFMTARNPLVHGSVMVRASIFADGIRYDPALRKNQDFDLWSRLAHRGIQLANLPEPLLRFRMDEGFYARRGGWAMAWQEVKIRYAHLRRFRLRSIRNLARLVGIFALRLSPTWAKQLAYRALR